MRTLPLQEGGTQRVTELTRYPACAAPSDEVLRNRIARATDELFATKEGRTHRERRGAESVGVGCEEQGSLLVSLTLGLGVDIRYAIGASLVCVIATSSGAAAAFVREGFTNIRVGMFLEIATTIGALLGTVVAVYVSSSALAVSRSGSMPMAWP